jgi:putative phosphoesterase
MRLAFISDIHANIHALNAAAERIEQEAPDKIICVGDVVGYGAYPLECIDWVRKNCEFTVQGNHDFHAIEHSEAYNFNPRAYAALAWTGDQLGEEEMQWLNELPISEVIDDALVIHGHPMAPEAWLYILDGHQADLALRLVDQDHVITGHSHMQGCFFEGEGRTKMIRDEIIDLRGRRAVLNPGSVGQPRDGDARAAFGILDTDEKIFTLIRVDYDVESARVAIMDAGLPKELGDRLLVGY